MSLRQKLANNIEMTCIFYSFASIMVASVHRVLDNID